MKERPRVLTRDLFGEISRSLGSRPTQTLTTALGAILGVAAFVATLSLGLSGQAQVGSQFDALKATEVRLQDVSPKPGPQGDWHAADNNLRALNGVTGAGARRDVNEAPAASLSKTTTSKVVQTLPVVGVSSGYWTAAGAVVQEGRLFDDGHSSRRDSVAVIGTGAAQKLGIASIDGGQAILLGDRAYTIIGIVSETKRDPDILLSVMLPLETATAAYPANLTATQFLVATEIGAANAVGSQAALAVSAAEPDRFLVSVPPEPTQISERVQLDVDGLTAALTAMSLGLGTITIGNTVMSSVRERSREIGLRRALGARRSNIAFQFLGESTLIGLMGGLIGTCIGTVLLIAVTAIRGWTPVLDPILLGVGPLLGLAAGLMAGIYPALRAARMQPVVALSR